MNIFLIGFMGTGKSTISAVLGKELSTEVIEMDELIVKRQGMPISQIFETRGEEYFRELETGLLVELQQRDGVIVSCGGGTPMRECNVAEMKKSGIIVAGQDDLAVRFSKCCSPVPGDEIIGFVTRGRGVSIHRTDCVNVMNMNEADRQRIIEAEWQVTPDKEENELYDTELVIYAYDRIGVLLDLTRVFTESGITINNVNSRTSKQGIATITIGFAIRSVEALHVLTAKLRQVESVKDIQRTHS